MDYKVLIIKTVWWWCMNRRMNEKGEKVQIESLNSMGIWYMITVVASQIHRGE